MDKTDLNSPPQSENSEIGGRKKTNHWWSISSKDVAYVSIDSGFNESETTSISDSSLIKNNYSVFEAPEAVELYKPIVGFEGSHRFDPSATWTPEEEKTLVRKACFT
jgi:hypothetical protein